MMAENAKSSHVIVIGNEKGGSGKSTVAMHIAVGLLHLGYKVATVDLDSHQASLTTYIQNRSAQKNKKLLVPEHIHIPRAEGTDITTRRDDERVRVEAVIADLKTRNDFVVVDTPGSDRYMSIIGHSCANTLVTPINDSFIDLDLLAKVNGQDSEIIQQGVYTEMIWDLRRQQKAAGKTPMDWFVMRNRVTARASKNKKDVGSVLNDLCYKIGCRIAVGLNDRVIYRSLFLQGKTLFDTGKNTVARQEVENLLQRILPQIDKSVSKAG